MKIWFLVGILFVTLSCVGCGKQAPPMDKEQIVNILQDVHIAEALINGHHPAAIRDSLEKRYLSQVLKRWNTTEAEFETAMAHMHGDPDYMVDVYNAVKEQIGVYSDSIDQSGPPEEKSLGNF